MTLEKKRSSWTKGERAARYQEQGGRCAHCEVRIDLDTAVAEHELPVALGNRSKPDYLLCRDCARAKTEADLARIAKAKRQGMETGQQKRRREGKTKKIPSRGFPGWLGLNGERRWKSR